MKLPSVIQIDTVAGTPVETADLRVTPEARAVVVRLPFGGWVWNRPVAVSVERDGETRRVPIPDPMQATRLITGLALALLALFTAINGLALARRLIHRR